MTDEKKLKNLPYGISDFAEFSGNNLYYVDKTKFIRNLEEKGSFLFLIRPRRFGKSLFLSMMEYYYDILHKDLFDTLFQGTEIQANPTDSRNSFLVLKFNFSDVTASLDKVEQSFLNHIKNSAELFLTRYRDILKLDKNDIKTTVDGINNPPDILATLLKYSRLKNQKLYVIIDEYDNFANTILSVSGEKSFQNITHGEGFLRAFFNVIKAGATGSDAPISRLFMTGVSPITLDDVTSGFNIASNITLDRDIDQIMGFTSNEVQAIIEYYGQTGKIKHSTADLLEIMGQWYNHYRFSLNSTGEVFNTVHIWYFLREYLLNSNIPYELIDNNARIDYNKLRYLILVDKEGKKKTNGNFSKLREIIETNSVRTFIKKGFPAEALTESENFYSLLYYFGLLTITGISPSNQAILSIPNEFVKHLYYDYLKETMKEAYSFHIDMGMFSNLIEEMAFYGKWEGLITYIGERMEASLSLRDLMGSEKAQQVFWNVYLGLSTLYNVYSEKEMNQGYADLVMEPLLSKNPGIKFSYIIEIKYIKPADYEKLEKEGIKEKIAGICKEGEMQLNSYSRDEKFKKIINATTLKKLILIFSGNRLIHHAEFE